LLSENIVLLDNKLSDKIMPSADKIILSDNM
jgi:hypothetical protein